MVAVIKMRGGSRSHDFHEYTISSDGAVIGDTLQQYQNILTGFPELRVVKSAEDPGARA